MYRITTFRFTDMTTEWLALWIHFLWSGTLIIACAFIARREMGQLLKKQHGYSGNTGGEGRSEGVKQLLKQRRRLLHIAEMVCLCLFLNAVATLETSSRLGEWSRTADVSLACEIKETWNSRAWEDYGFEDKAVTVCSVADSTMIGNGDDVCTGNCVWYPRLTKDYLACPRGGRQSLDGVELRSEPGEVAQFYGGPCDCPCTSMIEIERPRLVFSGVPSLFRGRS
jgi:hypothetical protein